MIFTAYEFSVDLARLAQKRGTQRPKIARVT